MDESGFSRLLNSFGHGGGVGWGRAAATLLLVVPLVAAMSGPPALAAASGQAAATVAVQMSADSVAVGSPLQASVLVHDASGVGVPSGSVQFTVDGAAVGSPVSLTGGRGTMPVALTVGAHAVSAQYSGDSVFAAGDAGPGATEVVTPAGTSDFTPVQPIRILDTRPGARQNGYTGAKPAPGAIVTLQVAGRGGVPASGVSAVALNVTATDVSASGYVTVWPAGSARPLASNLNPVGGDTIPNLVVVPLSAKGAVDLYTTTSLDLVADVAGYFTPALSSAGGRLAPISPARLLDTRNGTGYSGPKPRAGSTVTLQVAGRGGVPAAGARGVVLNMTATGTASGGGYVTVWPSDQPRPLASNLNFTRANETIPNAVWVPLSATGTVSIYVSTDTNVVADVSGWFTGPAAPDGTAGLFVPTPPTRILDTRPGSGQVGYIGPKPAAGSSVVLKVGGTGPVPATGAAAAVLNVTVTQNDDPGYVTAYPTGTARPLASNLNMEVSGQTRPNLVTTPLGSGAVNLYTTATTHLVADLAGYFTADLDPPLPVAQHETYQPAASTAVLDPGDVTAVSGGSASGYTLTLAPGVAVPANGAGVLLKGGGSLYPDGLAGTVTSTSVTGGVATVLLTPTPPDQLFDSLDIGYDGSADLSVESTATSPGARPRDVIGGSTGIDKSIIDFGAGAFACDTAAGVSVSASLVRFENTRVHFEKRVGLLTTPFVSFYVQTEPVVQFSGDIHGKVTCQLSDAFRSTHRLVWVLPTEIPVTVDLAPALQFEATIAGHVDFVEHFYRMVGLSTNPDLSLHLYNAASQRTESVGLGADVSASLLIGADLSVKVLDVAGLGVTLGPQFVASVDTSQCVRLSVSIHADFDVRLDLWIKQFKRTFLSVDVGPWTLYYQCPPGAGGGGTSGSPLTILTTSLHSALVGQPYSASLQAVGGTPPYSWQVTGLPAGMTSDAAGDVGGTPTASDSATLNLTVTDAAGHTATGIADFSSGFVNSGAALVTVGVDGRPGNDRSENPMISGDGAYVYFESAATNLTHDLLPMTNAVYVYDVAAKTTSRVELPDGSTQDRLLTISSNGRYALIVGDNGGWRYDRVTGAVISVPMQGYGVPEFDLSDDGDLLYSGNWDLTRISGAPGVGLTCPDGRTLFGAPDWVTFRGNGSVVYFIADQCGQTQTSLFRYDMATQTTTLVTAGRCFFNGGNLCIDQVEPTLSDAHRAVRVLAPGGSNIAWTLTVDGTDIGNIVSPLMYLCGISEDGKWVTFSAGSDILADGTPGGQDVFTINTSTAAITRLSPISGPLGDSASYCTAHGYSDSANLTAYGYNEQIYLQTAH